MIGDPEHLHTGRHEALPGPLERLEGVDLQRQVVAPGRGVGGRLGGLVVTEVKPFGLAVSGYESGLAAEIYVSFYGALFLQSVRSEDKRRVMELAQVDFRRRAELYGIPVNYRPFTIDDIRDAIAEGKLVLVLIIGFLMFGKKVPHWVLAIGDDGDHILIHDPWVEDERQETILDAANIPVPHGIFMNMAQFGRDGLRAAITLGKR